MRRFLLSIILICLLAIPILAHPGRTDGSGGHYDRDTGEYHYHHGYGPHQHEDLDGDGDLDCPYNFKDKTGENSGESSGSTTRYPTYTRPTVPLPTMPAPAVAEPEQEAQEEMGLLGVLLLLFSPAILPLTIGAIIDWRNRRNSRSRGKPYHGPPVWEGHPERTPLKAASPTKPPVKQLSFFEERKPEQTGDPDKLVWKSAYEEMKYTRITDRYIHIKDLELVAGYFAVDTDTALQLLNDDRIHNGMPPLELLKV